MTYPSNTTLIDKRPDSRIGGARLPTFAAEPATHLRSVPFAGTASSRDASRFSPQAGRSLSPASSRTTRTASRFARGPLSFLPIPLLARLSPAPAAPRSSSAVRSFLHLMQPPALAHFQAPILRLPVEERSFIDTDPAAKLLHRNSGRPALLSTLRRSASLKRLPFIALLLPRSYTSRS
jgi:hypothetical protein